MDSTTRPQGRRYLARGTSTPVIVMMMVMMTTLASLVTLSDAFAVPSSRTTSKQRYDDSSNRKRWSPRPEFPKSTSATATQLGYKIPGIEVSDITYDSVSTAFDAWEWTNAIGAPAALVAGAVLVTLSESREDTAPRKSDTRRTRLLKLSMRFLLLTSFAFEVVSIFTATITGTVLLGQSETAIARRMVGYDAPLQLMKHHHEFEMLTTQICFLQGLFNWLAAVAVELRLPKDKETKSAKRMNKALVGWLSSMMIWMLAFYNHHLSFYRDYFHMLRRFACLFVKIYIFERPVRPLALIYFPSMLYSGWLTWRAFRSPPEQDDD